jgi:hypothetical protein
VGKNRKLLRGKKCLGQKWERREREGARRRARCKKGEVRVKMQGTLGALAKHGGEKGVKLIFGTFGPIN